MKKIAIIPARGGSKRIPRKNVRDFLGHPIISYSIQSAINSKIFDLVMVSTDDLEIAEIAVKYGASVPFMRSEKTANDYATTVEVLIEVLQQYKELGIEFEIGACIYATAPLISVKSLADSYNLLVTKNYDSVFPIQKFSFPIQRALKFEDDKIGFVNKEYANSRSQDLETCYHDSGQFYFFDVDKLLINNSLLTSNTSCIVIEENEAQDIDNEEDWLLAEIKYKIRKDGF